MAADRILRETQDSVINVTAVDDVPSGPETVETLERIKSYSQLLQQRFFQAGVRLPDITKVHINLPSQNASVAAQSLGEPLPARDMLVKLIQNSRKVQAAHITNNIVNSNPNEIVVPFGI